jgi:hypothetical protein
MKFYVINWGKKYNNHTDDVIEDIVFYRGSEINKNIVKKAIIDTYGEKKYEKKIEYIKEKDTLIIRQLKMPIYMIKSINLE